jgi:hypothetical protein
VFEVIVLSIYSTETHTISLVKIECIPWRGVCNQTFIYIGDTSSQLYPVKEWFYVNWLLILPLLDSTPISVMSFLLQHSSSHPNASFLGFEISLEVLELVVLYPQRWTYPEKLFSTPLFLSYPTPIPPSQLLAKNPMLNFYLLVL